MQTKLHNCSTKNYRETNLSWHSGLMTEVFRILYFHSHFLSVMITPLDIGSLITAFHFTYFRNTDIIYTEHHRIKEGLLPEAESWAPGADGVVTRPDFTAPAVVGLIASCFVSAASTSRKLTFVLLHKNISIWTFTKKTCSYDWMIQALCRGEIDLRLPMVSLTKNKT